MSAKYFAVVFIILMFISSCSTMNDTLNPIVDEQKAVETKPVQPVSIEDLSLFTTPSEDSFKIFAISPRFLNPIDEQNFALASAARQISIYYGAQISYQRLIDENIVGTIQIQQVDIDYNRDLALSIIDKLEIVEESDGLDYYAAIVRLNDVRIPLFPTIELIPGTKPAWINEPPQFEGYLTGVGISGQRKSVYDSWEQADKLAMAEIAESINTNIQSGTANIERGTGSRQESASVIKTFSVSDVYLNGIYIISRWREPDNSYYYSFAITRKP